MLALAGHLQVQLVQEIAVLFLHRIDAHVDTHLLVGGVLDRDALDDDVTRHDALEVLEHIGIGILAAGQEDEILRAADIRHRRCRQRARAQRDHQQEDHANLDDVLHCWVLLS